MKNKILYIASLNTVKNKFDGERIKSTHIFDALKSKYTLSLINFSKNRLIQIIKLIFLLLFKKNKFSKIIISKDPHGANIIYKILHILLVDFSRVIYFEIGPFLYDRILNKSINKNTFINDSKIIVETNTMKKDLCSLGFRNVFVFPNFKDFPHHSYTVSKKYPKSTLKLIYLSRIEEMKGVFDLISILKNINKDEIMYSLDIYGMFMSKKDEQLLFNLIKNCPYIQYKGKIDLFNEINYGIISNYDLHIFPTKYSEGFPGTILDFFFVKVPTISSKFRSCYDILSDNDSFIYEQGNNDELKNLLEYIYLNQEQIINKAKKIPKHENYSVKSFNLFLDDLLS